MFNSSNDKPTLMKIAVAATFIAALAVSPLAIAQEHEHGSDTAASKEGTGEGVDMMCYVDHNAGGEKHGQSCGAKCIKSGGPGGVVGEGKADLGGGGHKPHKKQVCGERWKTINVKRKTAGLRGNGIDQNA